MTIESTFSIRFWGVRGSYPTPGASTVRYGGNTPCVEVNVNGYTLILDGGTGIIPLGRDLVRRANASGKPVEAVILFSHLHHDHTQGIPFFVPAFLSNACIHLYGPDFSDSSPKLALTGLMNPPYFPIRLSELNADLRFATLREADVLLMGDSVGGVALTSASESAYLTDPDLVQVHVLRSYAHPNGVLHYRIDWHGHSVVYATDTEGYVNGDVRLSRFARKTSLLIHDAQYTEQHYQGLEPGFSVPQGYGHSTTRIACEAALAAQAEHLVLFHHAPEYGDDTLDQIAEQVQGVFPGAMLAREGLEIALINESISVSSFTEQEITR